MGETHLEAPTRIKLIEDHLRNSKLDTKFIDAKTASKEDIVEIHSPDLYTAIEASSQTPQTMFTMDTIANEFTYDAALTAVGGAIQVADHIKGRSSQFGMLRPPGHHSTFDTAMGFCFFNNIAITANTLLKQNFRRIAIIDVDHHHGNGTQDLFYLEHNVLYTSMHADPAVAFPGTGYSADIGHGDGIGKTVNIPLPIKTTDEDWLVGFDEVIAPIVEQYKPDAILVSLGLDALEDDPYGVLSMTPDGYFEIGKRIGELGNKLCKKRVGVMLEGGYKYHELGIATEKFFSGLIDFKQDSIIKPNLHYRFEQVLREVKGIQRNHWFDI
ncbi:MAG: Acetylpolyamine aminohydrolase [Candidatus Heimdallarchaeota archaeon LC_2]|nr:MAG: Acetylpolyamine aminohydrolase [Candidatus Heimdallarchaeota archaeon LC_2]